jgi:molecular chaperone DnaK
VMVEDGATMKKVDLATRDTPEALKKAIQEALPKEPPPTEPRQGEEGGLFSSITRVFRRR